MAFPFLPFPPFPGGGTPPSPPGGGTPPDVYTGPPRLNTAPTTATDTNAAANSVAEGAAVNTLVGITAHSTDAEQAVTYALASDSSGGGFKIDPATGVVTVADPTKINFETAPGHAYTITVNSSDGGISVTAQSFTINVSDIAPSTPVDSNAAANTVAEGAAANTLVGITASSTDINGPAVTYSLSNDANGAFKIDAITGVVSVADPSKIDFESTAPGHVLNITAVASDGTLSSSQNFAINVSDVALTAPVDGNGAANSVAEGAANGSIVGVTAVAVDPNGPATTYSLTADSSLGGFTINAVTGVVTVADSTKIDYETSAGHAYSVTVQATNGVQTTSQAFTIAVADVAPSTPVDSNAGANTVAEGAANGSTVGVTASSTDVNGPGVTYSLVGDTSGGGFTINAATGVVTVADSSKIDFETAAGHAYTVTAQASDGTLSNSQTFTIAVSDVAPSTPVDSNAAANSVAEGAANGSTVGVTASSTDVNGPGVTYTLTADAGGRFTIDSVTGIVTVANGALIDFETTPGQAYGITAQASDGTLTSSQNFIINVANAAPLTPVDSNAAANTVAEGAANGSTVGVTASSTDVNGPAVTYSLVGDTSGGGFTINSATGVVTVADSTKLDFETSGGSYTVVTQASDGALTSSQAFVINVSDVAPSAPVDSDNTPNVINEGVANGVAFGLTAASTDINGGTLTYSLIGDSTNGGFTINPTTGVIRVADTTKIDYETSGGTLSLTVQASDGTLSNSHTFTVVLNNTAPSVPTDTDAAADSVAEGAANGSAVGVTASSIDPGAPGVTYSLADSAGGRFAIDAVTGIVTVANSSAIDYETAPGNSYTIVVRATDGGGLFSQQSIVIGVSDVAPSTPVDGNAAANSIAEGAANGSTVGITAASTDVNGPAVTYSLIGDTSGGGFTINAATGVITVADATKINYETAAGHAYTVTAQASDGTLSTSQAFTIDVTDVAPTTPVDNDPGNNQVVVGSAAGATVGVTALSSDVNGPAVTYTLIGDTSGGGFTINATTGVVTVADPSKILAAAPSYDITIDSSDGTLHSQQTFTVAVVTNLPPAIDTDGSGPTAAKSVAENQTAVTTVHATDPDNGPTVPVSYSIVGGDDQLKFAIDSTTGVLTFISAPDFENPTDTSTAGNNTYIVTVRAFDGASSDDQTITVTVTDANDAPVVTSNGSGATASINVNENSTAVTTVTSTDQDSPAQTLTYSLAGGADQGKFSIDPNTGVLTFNTAPNFEAPTDIGGDNGYDVIVRVTDNGAPNLHDDQAITVHVQNVNEAPDTAPSTVTGNEDAASIAITINGSDVDSGDSVASFHITNIPNAGTQGTLYSDIGLTTVVTEGANITASGNAATLYFVPKADFNTHAGAVTFNAAATDSLGLTDPTPATETINVTAVDDAPVNNGVPAPFTVMSGFTHAITGLSISDVDANEVGIPNDITTTFTAGAGTVVIGNGASGTNAGIAGGATITTNGSGTVVLTGTVAQINTTLSGNQVIYTAADGVTSPSTTTLTVKTDDHGHNGVLGAATDTDVIQVGVIPQVWFIDQAQVISDATAPRGSQANPFSTVAEFNGSSGPGVNDYIYVKAGTYSGDGINLKDGQTLLGDDQALSFTSSLDGSTIVIETASGARPTISVTTNGDQGIDLASGNTIAGINITTATGTSGLDDGNNAVGNLTVSHMAISGAGQAVDIDQGGGALNVVLDSTSSSGGAQGIQLAGAWTGTFNAGSGTLSGHTAAEVDINGGAGAFSYSGAINDGSGLSASVNGRSGGSVLLSGTISDGIDAGGGITVANNSGGTIGFSSASSSLNTGATAAISIGNNTATTVNFSGANLNVDTTTATGVDIFNNSGSSYNFTGGGLTIDTTTGPGFSVSGGGTVTVTGANNHVATAGAPALSIVGTTIGAAGVTFKDISANGGTNGIVLNNTGTSGGLTVTGDAGSTKNGSGGLIQNTSGAGISLINTRDVVLDQLNITGSGGSGVDGTGVTNFSYTNGVITNAGNGSHESAIAFGGVAGTGNNIAGQLVVSNNTFTNAFYAGLNVESDAGTVTHADIVNNIITNPGFSGINFSATGTATTAFSLNDADIANNNISGSGGNGIQISIGNGNSGASGAAATAHAGFVTIDGAGRPVSDPSHIISIFNNLITLDTTGTQAITVANTSASANARTQTNFEILNNGTLANPLGSSGIGTVILIGNNGFSDMAGLVDNNRIVASHSPDLGNGNGIAGGNGVGGAGAAWTPRLSLTVSNNNIAGTDGSGILLVNRATSGEAYLKINDNIVSTPLAQAGGSGAESGIRVDAGNGAAGEDAAVYLNIFGNTSGGHDGALGIGVRKQGTNAAVNVFGLYDAAGGPVLPASPTNTDIVDFITALNPNGGGAYVVNGSNFVRDTTLALPLLAGPGGIEAATPTSGEMHLTQAQLNSVVAAAIAQWAAAGASQSQLAMLHATTFSIADLSGTVLGEEAAPAHITIDIDAAGRGWFIDSTPRDNLEFSHALTGTDLLTDPANAAAGHFDLLTTVSHELGHVLGLPDTTDAATANGLMFIDLAVGERRLPGATDIASAPTTTASLSVGTAGNDAIDAGHGGGFLFGGAGADTFVFADVSLHTAAPPAPITHVTDYSFAEGDRFDFSALTSQFHATGADDAMIVRAVEDASGQFATLQVNATDPGAPPSTPNWVSVAQIDGAHAGDAVSVMVDSHSSVHLAQIHVGLLV